MQVLEKSDSVTETTLASSTKSEDLPTMVRDETLTALVTGGIIKAEERDGFQNYLVSNSVSTGDILPVMAQLRGIEEGEQIGVVSNWARTIAPIVKKRYALVPFAGKLLGNSTLFKNYGTVLKAAEALKCPLIYSEDIDALGFGTLNPVAGVRLSEFVVQYLSQQTGVSPYISMFLLDLPSWELICRRQFEK